MNPSHRSLSPASSTEACARRGDPEDPFCVLSPTSSGESRSSPSSVTVSPRRLLGEKRSGGIKSLFVGVLVLSIALLTILPVMLASSVLPQANHEGQHDHRITSASASTTATGGTKKNTTDQHIYDVLIIGAGWSGLAAGDALVRNGVKNFEILEARNSVGGRSRTVYPFADDLAVEIGSAWTYEDTEVHDMMLAQKIPHGEIHYDRPETFGLYQTGNFREDNGTAAARSGEVSRDALKKLMGELWWGKFVPYSREARDELRESGRDKPYQEVLDIFLREHGYLAEDSKARQFLQAMVHAQVEIEWAAPLQELSAIKVGTSPNECLFCDADYYVPVQGGGFDKILAPLANPLKNRTKLNHVVTKIEHFDDQPARVTYTTRSDGKQHTKKAKIVLVTVPLGVLKAKSIAFVPSLPQSKQDAIDFVGFGVLDKCIFYWETEQSWWPNGKELMTLITDKDSTTGNWTTFFNDKELGNGGHSILSAWTGGDDAIAIEKQTDEAIVDRVLSNLRAMLGDQVPPPSKYVISRWGQDEFARGSYSFDPVGREELIDAARRELGARVGTRLFWAGEATQESWSGTTVGAYRSGISVVDDILLSLRRGLPQRKDRTTTMV